MDILQGDAEPSSLEGSPQSGPVSRRLAAIFAADIKGYSALMNDDEETTHSRVGVEMDRLVQEIEKSQGSVFSFAGDGLMAEFPSAVEALRCALRVQSDAARRSAALPPDRRIEYRIGINAGEVLVQRGHTGGIAVNIAARLEQIATPGSIFLSEAVYDQVSTAVTVNFSKVGQPQLKNLREPVVVFSISAEECQSWGGIPPIVKARPAVPPAVTTDRRASLAVLPFRTMQDDAEGDYFSQGIVDDIIRILGGLKDLLVVSRSSTLGFARLPVDLRRIRQDLDVRYVLHGSVRRSRDRLRISVELNEAETARVIWAERFDGGMADLFDLQDRIALQVATAVAPQVLERELLRIGRLRSDSLTAYDLTLQALDLIYRTDRVSFFKARDLLGLATEIEPTFGPAHCHTAYWHVTCIGQGWSDDPQADARLAAVSALAAIERDGNDALALAVYGHTQSYLKKDYRTATEFQERALAAGPSCAWAWSFSSLTCGFMGDAETALVRAQQAVRLSPIGPDCYWHEHVLSQAHYINGNFEEAASWGRLSAAHNGTQTSNLRTLIASLVVLGRLDEAREFAQQLLEMDPDFRVSKFRKNTPLRGALRDEFAQRLRLGGLPE